MLKKLFGKLFKLNRKKNVRVLVSLILFISLCTGTLDAYAQSLHNIKINVDGNWKIVKSSNITVGELLKSNNIELGKKDKIDKSLDYLITDDTDIFIDKAESIIFQIDGESSKRFSSNGGSVGVALYEFQQETGRIFKLKEGQSPAKELKNNMIIKLTPYYEKIVTKTADIPFTTSYVENPNLPLGTQNIKVAGVNGSKEIKTKELYLEGNLASSSVVSEKITKNPVNQVIEKGTKANTVKTEKGTFSYIKKIAMKSTAYTAGFESTGKNPGDAGYGITASGMKAQRGVVAVDTKVIPFGTKLYIEGYGYAVAGDTGGAIKGNKIDVFVNTYAEARNWGVRTVNVYVLE
ncbi:MAG: G5 domain-containing protein [Eubacteriales bacterium]|nr:G5 domain-containing protein [Eubacteriales bacterium]